MIPTLNADEIHIWSLDFSGVSRLDPGELQPREFRRYQKIQHPVQAQRYLASRIQLRTLLAGYCGVQKHLIEIKQSTLGKPYLLPSTQHIEFNLSHTGDTGLLAIAQSLQLGIDIELIRPLSQKNAITRRVFPSKIVDIIGESDENDRSDLFFKYWTRMEAAQKTFGKGIFSEKINHNTVGMYTFSPNAGFVATLAWSDPAADPAMQFLNYESRRNQML